MTAVHKLQLGLQRAVVLRQVNARQWRVEGYERHAGGWRYTWLLCPATTKVRAQAAALTISQDMGLPMAEQPLWEQIRFITGTLGRSAWRARA